MDELDSQGATIDFHAGFKGLAGDTGSEYITHTVTLSDVEMTEYMRLNTMLSVQLGDEVVAFSENQKFAKLQTLCNGFVYVDDVRAVVGGQEVGSLNEAWMRW